MYANKILNSDEINKSQKTEDHLQMLKLFNTFGKLRNHSSVKENKKK